MEAADPPRGTDGKPLERELLDDLDALGERIADEEFCSDLYRALANNVWFKRGRGNAGLSLSWKLAEELINEARTQSGQPVLELAQSGGEGEVSALIVEELGGRGWSWESLDTTMEEPGHTTSPKDPPPTEQGEAQSPRQDSHEWERVAHEEAERTRKR